jgi:hypothetical protein
MVRHHRLFALMVLVMLVERRGWQKTVSEVELYDPISL